MKTFLFSLCALALLIGVILVNAAFVGRVTDSICKGLQDLPQCEKADAQARALLESWQAKERVLELSVCAADLNEISNHLTEICTAAQQNDEEAFEQARALCLLGLARIRDLERFSLLHIL